MFVAGSVLKEYREVMGDEFNAFLADMLDTFFQYAPELIVDLKRAISSNDPRMFMFAAHKLKSNVKTFGAQTLAEIACEMESMGMQGTLDGAAEMVTSCETEYKKLNTNLQTLRQSLAV